MLYTQNAKQKRKQNPDRPSSFMTVQLFPVTDGGGVCRAVSTLPSDYSAFYLSQPYFHWACGMGTHNDIKGYQDAFCLFVCLFCFSLKTCGRPDKLCHSILSSLVQ